MYDSTTAADIPTGAVVVAGYVDGSYRWSAADWDRFPDATKVRIATLTETDDGQVLDVETGDATPGDSVGWVKARRRDGIDPSLYVNLSNVGAVREAFVQAGIPLPHLWLAHYDGVIEIPVGFVAKQYADQDMIPGKPHYDLSVVLDSWPGIDGGDMPTDDELRAAIKRIYSGPDSLEELVKADIRMMVAKDPETIAAIEAVASDDTAVRAIGTKIAVATQGALAEK